MVIFELIFCSLALLSLLQISTKDSAAYIFLLGIVSVWMAYVAGFRLSSPDYVNYYNYFVLLANGADFRQINIVAADPAFAYLNIILSNFYNDPIIIFVFFSFASVLINAFCYKKYVKYFFISMFFYLVHTYVAREFMQIRAGLACAICLYSLRYINDGKKWKFVITVMIASTFHLAASMFLFAYVLGRLKLSSREMIIAIIVSFAIALIYPIGALFKLLPNYAVLERVQYYNETVYGEKNGLFTNIIIIKELLIIAVCLYRRALLEKLPYFKISFNLYVFSLLWLVLWDDFSIVASRIATFYSITEVLIFAMFPFIVKEGMSRKIMACILVLGAAIIMLMNISTGKWDDIVL